jgi:hypothetical protein
VPTEIVAEPFPLLTVGAFGALGTEFMFSGVESCEAEEFAGVALATTLKV